VVGVVSEEAQKANPGDKAYDRWIKLEEMMKVIKGSNIYDLVKAAEMCLVSNVIVPKDFQLPEFIKYTGMQCSLTHLNAYCNKMAQVVHEDKLLIHFFQDSLSDVALVWYMRLNIGEIRGLKDLVGEFLK
jgi:hypothetical protein